MLESIKEKLEKIGLNVKSGSIKEGVTHKPTMNDYHDPNVI